MIPIIMPIYNRQQYLTQVLNALKNCKNIDKFYIETFEETARQKTATSRTHTIKENTKIFEKIRWINIKRNINPGVKGCAGNIIGAIDYICKTNKHFVVLEDDIVPAVDFLDLMLFGFEKLDNQTVWVQSQSISRISLQEEMCDKISKCNLFVCWGWGASSDIWFQYRRDFSHPISANGSWAIPFAMWLLRKNYLGYQCSIDRSQNIGKFGTFITSEFYEKHIRNDDWYGKVNQPVEFKLLNECTYAQHEKGRFKALYDAFSSGVFDGLDYRICFKSWENIKA